MKISKKDIAQRMIRFEEACRNSGSKLTHQRVEIFREVAQTGDHPDVEKVYQGVRTRIPTVSMDTVYRTLWWLKDLGMISILGPPRDRARFDANLSRHHHFVCSKCGLTRDFFCDEFDGLKLPDSLRSIGQVEKIQVEAVGICNRCATKGNPHYKKRKKEDIS